MDTLGSQWTEKTMTRYFLNNQLAAPVVPGTTSELSPPDVGLHAFQKQVIRQGNIDIQAHAGVEPGDSFLLLQYSFLVLKGSFLVLHGSFLVLHD